MFNYNRILPEVKKSTNQSKQFFRDEKSSKNETISNKTISINQLYSNSLFLFIVCVIGVVLSFVILFYSKNDELNIDEYKYRNNSSSNNIYNIINYSLVISISIISYKLFELVIDSMKLFDLKSILMIYSLKYIYSLILSDIACIIFYILIFTSQSIWITTCLINAIQLGSVYTLITNNLKSNKLTKFKFISKLMTIVLLVISNDFLMSYLYTSSRSHSYSHNKILIVSLISIILCIIIQLFNNIKYVHNKIINVSQETKSQLHITILDILFNELPITIFFIGKLIIFGFSNTKIYRLEWILLINLLLIYYLFYTVINILSDSLSVRFIMKNNELESKSTFIRTISHEIRSPLSTVNLGIEMLIENISKHLDTSDDRNSIDLNDLEETLRDIKISVDVALNTLNDLLSLDKIKSNLMTIEMIKVKINNFIIQSLRPFKVQAKAAKVGIEYNNLNGELLNHSISIDIIRMEQVLRNFLSNAMKFSPANSKVSIIVKVLKSFSESIIDGVEKIPGPKGVVRISVIDQGAGISKDNQKKLFGQYVQIDSNRLQNGKGSGLGLWLSKTIVDLHGGVIGVESPGEGKGSSFFVELPLYDAIQNTINRLPNVKEITAARILANTKSPSRKFKSLSVRFQSSSLNDSDLTSASLKYSQYTNAINTVSKGGIVHNRIPEFQKKTKQIDVLHNLTVTPSSDPNIEPNISPQQRHKHALRSPQLEIIPSYYDLESSDNEKSNEIKKLNILIVDDAMIGRKMVQKVLLDIYNVCGQAKDGLEAYNIIRSNLIFYDVVLMDCYMPKMNGPESTKLMREAGFIGVILGCTGSSSSEDEEAFMNSGADGVLVKPLSVNSLKEILKSLGRL